MRKNNSIFIIFSFLVFLNIFAWIIVYDLNKPRFLEVSFFDVGQGDAIFIKTPQRHQILIDGGPDSTILEKLGQEMPFWDRSIDMIILSHPEHDHMAGLIEVLKRYEINYILWTGIKRDTAEYEEWEKLIKEEKAKIIIAKVGQRIKLTENIYLDIFYPFDNLEDQEVKNTNDTSIINLLAFAQHSFLFTGDIDKSVEKELIEKNVDLTADILKISHHGSKTSTSKEFIEKISPEITVISAGRDNKYGHPHQEVLERLENYGIRILRTDLDGDIKIISDGINYKIQ
ncbi:MAG: hypothetical protein A2Z78_00800 [Candidatus Nealsonbacteria bacterium RBG_13_36_15]|uniref:Metallo-beta-lactamase domain-containing protein n=1 Tax=Candidatus Nealsonbacteria bacterium RBG_13_36_15 TaxID=1801660 RepID=A0A1G2DUW1_9BACT|nr:MAG: hypothetical protein A2Z78_00800 [Candidatus Nealsonbacteria bacterium RBG_13_36_15]